MSTPLPRLLSEDQAAELLGIKPETLCIWRCTRRYPLAYIKVGRLVRYSEAAILDFIESRTRGGATEDNTEAAG
jgi:hypothetical protein